MVSSCVHWTPRFQQTKALSTSSHGIMLPWWQRRKRMGVFMSMTWRVKHSKNRNSWSSVIKDRISRLNQALLAMQFWSGLRTSMIPQERATTVSIVYNMFRSSVVEIGNQCLFSRTFSKTWHGFQMESSLSSFLVINPQLLPFMTKTANHFSNLVSVTVIPYVSVHFLSWL